MSAITFHHTRSATLNPRQARGWVVLTSHAKAPDKSVVTYIQIKALTVSDAEREALQILKRRKIKKGQVEQLTRVNP